jgi:hypothetical protein
VTRPGFLRGLIRELAASRGDCSVGSFMNCHVIGLHSIVLRERPMVRMFVTTPDHGLWRKVDGIPSTIAFHSHRSDLVLETVAGEFFNWLVSANVAHFLITSLGRFKWDSAINGGTGTFARLDGSTDFYVSSRRLEPGKSVAMGAAEIHTVEVEATKRAAWLVYEGEEDPAYEAISYSAVDLTAFAPQGLYRPMTTAESVELLGWVTGETR